MQIFKLQKFVNQMNRIIHSLAGGKNLSPSELLLTKEQSLVNEFPVFGEMDAEEREG